MRCYIICQKMQFLIKLFYIQKRKVAYAGNLNSRLNDNTTEPNNKFDLNSMEIITKLYDLISNDNTFETPPRFSYI